MRKIIFSRPDHYVKTNAGTKTETRRIHGLKELNKFPVAEIMNKEIINDKLVVLFKVTFNTTTGRISKNITVSSHYKINEQLFIAEPTFVDAKKEDIITPFTKSYYPFDFNNDYDKKKQWKEKGLRFVSPMFMKQCQAREFIKVTGIDCHQIQDISRESIIKEGYENSNDDTRGMRVWFGLVFDSINGTGAYLKNPFIFSYTYKRVNRKGEDLI